MDWVADQWPILAALLAMAVAWGKHSQRITAVEARQEVNEEKLSILEQRQSDTDKHLARELEAIKVALARIEEAVRRQVE